jgi:MFS family permease
VCALVTLLLGMTLGRPEGSAPGGFPWGSWQILGLLGFSALAFVAFWKQERRAEDPIIDPSLFSNRAFSRGLLAMFVAHAGPLAHVIFLPLFMVNVVGLSATQAGLTTTPMTMVVGVGNLLGGQLVARFGRYRSLLVTALALHAALLLMALVLTPDVTQTQVVLVMMLVGVGTGPLSPIYLMHIQSSVEPQRVGVASAAASCGRQLGGTIGIALIGTVFASVFTAQLHSRAPELRVTIPGGEEVGASSSQLSLDSAEARARINARLEPLIVAARQRDASGQEAAVLEGERRRALDEVGQLERAMKVSFTAGITRVYQVCMLLSVLALLMTLRMPEVMMRRRSRQVEAAAVE